MFGILSDLHRPFDYRHGFVPALLLDDHERQPRIHLNGVRPLRQTGLSSTVKSNSKKNTNHFKVMLNVKHFRPDEIEVKTVDNCIVIHGKHEEQADQHGFVSREFTRRYQPPDDVEPQTVKSSLSQDGVLTITAPRKAVKPPPANKRVPITTRRRATVEKARKQLQIQEKKVAPPGRSIMGLEHTSRPVSPVNQAVYPHLTLVLLGIGLFFMAWFFVYP